MNSPNAKNQNLKGSKIALNITIFLRNILFLKYKRYLSVFFVNVARQDRFLRSLPEPLDLFERSYFQYKCQMMKFPLLLVAVQHCAALFFLPIYCIKLASVGKGLHLESRNNTAVFFTEGISIQTIPECLKIEYEEIIPCKYAEKMYIGPLERAVLTEIFKRYWFSPFFLLKCMLKIGMYAEKINELRPLAIISYSEYSFTSSVLTEYCRLCGVEHINIMHGEKLFNIRDSFIQYDRYYVWDEYYISLFSDMRADIKQFHVAVPDSVKIKLNGRATPLYDYTYYLGGETVEELLAIRATLIKTGVSSSCICIRYHPRYSQANEIKAVFSGFEIEDPTVVSLDKSFSKTKFVVSLYSTVLYQAYENGLNIIIDDVTDRGKYEALKELRYIMLEKPHKKLSEFIQN